MVVTLQSSTGAQSAASNLLLARAHKKFEAIVIWDSPSYIPLNFQTAWLSWSILHFLKYILQKNLIDFAPLILLASFHIYGQWQDSTFRTVSINCSNFRTKISKAPKYFVPSPQCINYISNLKCVTVHDIKLNKMTNFRKYQVWIVCWSKKTFFFYFWLAGWVLSLFSNKKLVNKKSISSQFWSLVFLLI